MHNLKTLKTGIAIAIALLVVGFLMFGQGMLGASAKISVHDPIPGGMCRCMSCNCLMSEEVAEEFSAAENLLPEPVLSFLSAAQAAAVTLAAEKASTKTKEASKASTKSAAPAKTTTKEAVKAKPANTNTSSKSSSSASKNDSKEKEREKNESRSATQKSSTKDTYPYTAPSKATRSSILEKGRAVPVANESNVIPGTEASLTSPTFSGGTIPGGFGQRLPPLNTYFGKSQDRLAPEPVGGFGASGPAVRIYARHPAYSIDDALKAALGSTNDTGAYYEFKDTDGSLRYLDSEGRSVANPI